MVLTFGWNQNPAVHRRVLPLGALPPPDFTSLSSGFLRENDAELLAYITVEPIPEPSTLSFLVIGLAAVARRITRRSHPRSVFASLNGQ